MYRQVMHHLPAAPASICHAVGNAQSGLYAYAQSATSACKRRKLSDGLSALQHERRPTAPAAIPLTAIKTSWHAAPTSSRADTVQCRFAGKWAAQVHARDNMCRLFLCMHFKCRATLQEHLAGHADPVVSTEWLAEHLEVYCAVNVARNSSILQQCPNQICREIWK